MSNTARADVYRLYESERETLKRELASLPGRVSFTSDLWTSVKREGYMCVTAHYIDRNWKLNSKILTFCALPPPHTGMNVAIQLLDSLKEWGVHKKVFSVTLDNATSNDSMQDIVKSQLNLDDALLCGGEFFHVRCAAHILNLIVQDGLKVIGDSLHKVRESVKYVLSSETRDAKLKNLREKLSILFESYDKKSKNSSPSTEPRETVSQKASGAGTMGLFENYGVSVY